MCGIAQQEEFSELHWLGNKTPHGRNSPLQDRPVLQHKAVVRRHARAQLFPDALIRPLLQVFLRRTLKIKARHLRRTHAHQSKSALVVRVDQLLGSWRNLCQYSQPGKRVGPLMYLQHFRRNRRAADAMKPIASGDKVAGNFMTDSGVLVLNSWLGIKIFDPHRFRFEEQWRPITQARSDEVLYDLLLGINGDGLAHQILKINPMAFAAEAQLNAVMCQPFALHAITYAGFAQDVYSALLQHTRTHAVFHVLARVAFQYHRFDPLQVQKMRKRKPCRARADYSHLGANGSHRVKLRFRSYANFSMSSFGIGWLLALDGSAGVRIVHTRFSWPSTAKVSPRKSLC